MNIADFSSLIQLGVTLNVVLVAFDYLEKYVNTLLRKLFLTKEHVDSCFDDCEKLITDPNAVLGSIDKITIKRIDGNECIITKEELAKKRNDIKEDISIALKQHHKKIDDNCTFRSLSSLSLCISMYGIILLFLCGLQEVNYKSMFILMTFLTLLYMIIGWSYGEKRNQKRWYNFSYLRFSTIVFIGLIILSIIISCLIYRDIPNVKIWGISIYDISIYVALALIYSNFVIPTIILQIKGLNIESEAKKTSKDIKTKRIDPFNKEVNSYSSVGSSVSPDVPKI